MFNRHNVRDTKIPSEYIPLILLHWHDEHYYGGDLTPLDIRKFLESKLRLGVFTRDTVRTWIAQAEAWEIMMNKRDPRAVQDRLAQYFRIKLAA